MAAIVRSCPLCGSSEGQILKTVEYSDIWAALERQWSPGFAAELVSRHTPALQTDLRECAACGLRYFAPSVAGDPDFYEQLMRAAGYDQNRWEFEVVTTRLRPYEAVLDIGCGRGAFLRRIAPSISRPVGLDVNRPAISELAESGIEAHAIPIAEFANREPNAFDAVCAFQTLEHLANVHELIEPALRCVRPGGRLFLSVPNRNRAWREPFDPFDFPPHHVSQWDRAQFVVLARRYGLQLRAVEYEPPGITTFRRLKGARVRSRLSPLLGPRQAGLIARVYGRALVHHRGYARTVAAGEPERRGVHGHTMLAELCVGAERT
jgi:SAM-dependent methyltransferase